jgi:hypothetical protein
MKGFIGEILCGECKTNFIKHLEARGAIRRHERRLVIVEPKVDLFALSVDLHNEVNRATGKPEFTIEQARERWSR